MFKYLVFFILLLAFSCKKKGKNNPEACNGDTRREVKICTDQSSALIDTNAIVSSLKFLGDLIVPEEVKSETPRQTLELKTYTVTAKIDKLKKEWDGDYHLRLVDNDENYLISESANPDCEYASTSRFLSQIKLVREFIKTNEKNLEGKTVTITGVAFVDIDHHYKRKQAKNNLELHPILKISF